MTENRREAVDEVPAFRFNTRELQARWIIEQTLSFHRESSDMRQSKCIDIPGLAGLALVAMALQAQAGTLPADALPLPNRVATADIVIVGKVTAIEDKTTLVAPFPGAKNKTEYKVAVVSVSDALLAPKGTKSIRLGFVPIRAGVFVSPPPFQASVGQEGCFFLSKHADADIYVASGQLIFIDNKGDTFDKDLALIKRCTRILNDPNAALKGKDADDRFLAAGMLVAQYRTRKSPNAKTEPIDAEQSKLILQALAAADWTPSTDHMRLSPLMVLYRLPLTAKDGWAPPGTDAKAIAAYAPQWLNEHAGTYRIERFAAEKK